MDKEIVVIIREDGTISLKFPKELHTYQVVGALRLTLDGIKSCTKTEYVGGDDQ